MRAANLPLSSQLEEAIFIAAAQNCSTKSRAREIPWRFEDGRPPGPLLKHIQMGCPTCRPEMPSGWKSTTRHVHTCSRRSSGCMVAVVGASGRTLPGSHVCGTQANGRTPPMQPARWEGLILRHKHRRDCPSATVCTTRLSTQPLWPSQLQPHGAG